jgi:peptidoglycan hydrolase CwlO-like protein
MNLFRKNLPDTEGALATLQSEFDTLNVNFGSLQDSFRDSENMVATLNSQIAEMLDCEAQLKARISGLEGENATLAESAANIQRKASSIAIDTLASIGVAPVETENTQTILDDFRALSGKAQADFYQKHKSQILNLLNQ